MELHLEKQNGVHSGVHADNEFSEKEIEDLDKVETLDDDVDEESNTSTLTTWRRYLVLPIVCLYMLGGMMSYYIVTEYTKKVWLDIKLKEANLTDDGSSTAECESAKGGPIYDAQTSATAASSRYLMYYGIAQGVPAIVANLVIGPYADALGRKVIMSVGIIGTFLRLVTCMIIIGTDAKLIYFLTPCFIEGCSGQFGTVMQASSAYMGDITKTAQERTYGMAAIFVMIAIAITLAGLVTGYLVDAFGFFVSITIASIFLVMAILTLIFILPESFPKEKRIKNQTVKSMLYTTFSFFIDKDLGSARWKYQLLFAAHGLCAFTYLGVGGVETLYQMAEPFCWSVRHVGNFSAVKMLGSMLISMGPVKLYQKYLSDVTLTIMALMSFCTMFALEAIAWTDALLYVAAVAGAFGGLEGVMIKSITSILTDERRQGALFSAFSAIEIVMSLLSNVGLTGIYSATISFYKGFTFVLVAVVDVIALIILIVLYFKWRAEKRQGVEKI